MLQFSQINVLPRLLIRELIHQIYKLDKLEKYIFF